MGHELLELDNLAFTGTTPWHGLGTAMQSDDSIERWRAAAGLNWSILRKPVTFSPREELFVRVPDRQVFYRSDTNYALSIASNRFVPVQPEQIVQFFKRIVELHGFQLEVLGTLRNGVYIWGLARVGRMGLVTPVDPVRAYILVCTICKPGFATTVRFTSVRVVCNNTLQIAFSRDRPIISIPHIQQFDPEAVRVLLGLGVDSFGQFITDARRLATTKILNEQALDYFYEVVGDPDLDIMDPEQPEALTALQQEFVNSAGPSTIWKALNIVTYHVDFQRPNRGVGGRLASAWFGSGAKTKERALTNALKLAATV